MEQFITLNGRTYTFNQVLNEEVEIHSAFERNTVSFCQSWLNEDSQFSLTTSGSTGQPKKIILGRAQMIASAKKTADALGLVKGMNALVCMDTKYIAGKMMLVRSFVTGMNIYAVEPAANPFHNLPATTKIHFTALVPYQLQSILDQAPARLNQIDCALIGGAPVDALLKSRLEDVTCILYATYGMTETISHVALQRLNNHGDTHFKPLQGVRLRTDDRGCLVIETDYLPYPIITNDLVALKEEGQFNWLGRWDNVINSGGVKIIPEKIETLVEHIFHSLQLPNRFFITGRPDMKLGTKVCLIVEGNPFPEPVTNAIYTEMKTVLSKYESPKEILFIDPFIETESGKINRIKTSNLFPA